MSKKQARQKYSQILASLSEFGVDPNGIAQRCRELEDACIEGLISEKINQRSEDGKTSVLEVFPAVAAQCQKLQSDLYKWVADKADDEVEEDTNCQLIIIGDFDASPPDGELKRYGE